MLGNLYLGNSKLGDVSADFTVTAAPVTLEDVLNGGRVKPFYLATVSVAKFLPLWNLESGTTWEIGETDNVTNVKVNGVSLTPLNSLVDVNATAGSWFWNGTILYIHLSDATDPNTSANVVNGFLTFYFSSDATEINGRYWESRIQSFPGTSIRIEENFGGISQISGGSIKLNNEDGFFDARFKYQWDAGETTLQMGAEGVSFNNYKTLGTFLNRKKTKTDSTFVLQLKEITSRGKDVIPTTFYSRDDFQFLNEEDVGEPIQLAYGTILGGKPAAINRNTRTFQVAGHPIKSFQRVKVLTDQTWNTVDFETTDTALAQFTLSVVDWDGDQAVSVDFQGRINPDGSLMDNGSDMVKDILEQTGETKIDTASFEAAKVALEVGHVFQNTTQRVNSRIPSIYLFEETDVLSVLRDINKICGGYLKTTPEGFYSWTVFRAMRGVDLPTFTDADIESFSVQDKDLRELSKLTVRYAERLQEGRRQSLTVERVKNQYNRDEDGPVIRTVDLKVTDTVTAKQIAGRMLTVGEHPPETYTFTVKWGAFLLDAGDQIHLIYDRQGIDAILEVIEWKPKIGNSSEVKLTVANLHGFDNKSGFWSLSTETTPEGNSLDWNANERTYKRQNAGHWHNVNEFATNTPTDTQDYQTTIWGG